MGGPFMRGKGAIHRHARAHSSALSNGTVTHRPGSGADRKRRVSQVLVSLVAALVAALCYGMAAVMQAIAVRATSRRSAPDPARTGGQQSAAGVDPGLIIRMLRQWPFLASVGVDMAGFVCQLIALHRLPLFEVQVIIAANLAVTAVFASWFMHTALTAREWLAVFAVVIGVGMLGSSAGERGTVAVGVHFHLALIAALAAITLAGLAAARLPGQVRTPLLGAIAGLGYGVQIGRAHV